MESDLLIANHLTAHYTLVDEMELVAVCDLLIKSVNVSDIVRTWNSHHAWLRRLRRWDPVSCTGSSAGLGSRCGANDADAYIHQLL